MSPRPEAGNLATIAYDEMEPVWREDAAHEYPLLKFLHAYYIPLQLIDDLVRDRTVLVPWGIRRKNLAFNPRLKDSAKGWASSMSAGYTAPLNQRDPLPPAAGEEGFGWHASATSPDVTIRTVGSINPSNQIETAPVVGGRVYTVIVDTFVVSLTAVPSVRIDVFAIDALNASTGSSTGASQNAVLGWQRVARAYTVPAGSTRLRVNPEFRTDAVGEQVDGYFTKLMVLEGDHTANLPEYFDGDEPAGETRWQGTPQESVSELLRMVPVGRPGWSILFDPDLCPVRYLPWLAMFAGVRLTTGMAEEEMRSRIKDRDGLRRGTPGAIARAVQQHLTGSKTVLIRERFNHASGSSADAPGYLDVVTREDESPETDWKDLVNLIKRPSSEVQASARSTSPSSVGQAAASIVRTQDWARRGSWSDRWRITRDDGANVSVRTGVAPVSEANGYIPVTAGNFYAFRVSAHIRDTSGVLDDISAQLAWFKADTTASADSGDQGPQVIAPALGSVNDLYGIAQAPPDAAWVDARMLANPTQPGVVALDIDVDAWMVVDLGPDFAGPVEGATLAADVPEFADGDTFGWEWDGTPHDSASRRTHTDIIRRAALEQKDVGLIMTTRILRGQDWQQLITDYATWQLVTTDYATWTDVIEDTP